MFSADCIVTMFLRNERIENYLLKLLALSTKV